MDSSTRKQIKALKLAIKALTESKRKHAAGEAAYTQQGIKDLTFTIYGHKHYTEHAEAIDELEDLIEILTDPGVKIEAEQGQLL
jgi:xanthine dehydrogenase molybdopterin-binding subunit B